MADYTKEEIFEIITTDDPTSTENARLYCKNSQVASRSSATSTVFRQ